MMLRIVVPLVLATSVLAAQPSAPRPVEAPLRDLPWGQLNFLHTTDTHGWLGGHLQEASFSADWGDYISFAEHLRKRADEDGSDLLLIDTGDRVEGNGLYDASEPKGTYTPDIFKHQDIDVICSGNHELYKRNTSENEFNITVPNFQGTYLASNIDIYDPKTGKRVPLAPRFRKFKTRNQGIRIMAFGFLYDFTGNDNNTVVQRVEDTIKEDWFQDAIRDRSVDLFVVIGHVAARSKEYDAIYKAIRDQRWDTPIQFFAGHYHIRDYVKYDKRAVALASGRYMETIGFMAISGTPTKKARKPYAAVNFARRYIDNNLFSLYHHSGKNKTTFATEKGLKVSKMITSARRALELDQTFGCAPIDLWVNRSPYPGNNSIFSWLEQLVLPDQLKPGVTELHGEPRPALILTNTGAMRFDIFKGPFTKDTTYLVSPFTSGFHVIEHVPYSAAKQILSLLNHEGPILHSSSAPNLEPDVIRREMAPPEQLSRTKTFGGANLVEQGRHTELRRHATYKPLIPGYTTHDDDGDSGDDTIHSPIEFFDVPNCISAEINFPKASPNEEDTEEPETVDVIYNEFIEQWVIMALQYLGQDTTEKDTRPFMHGKTFTDIISDWIAHNWPCR